MINITKQGEARQISVEFTEEKPVSRKYANCGEKGRHKRMAPYYWNCEGVPGYFSETKVYG